MRSSTEVLRLTSNRVASLRGPLFGSPRPVNALHRRNDTRLDLRRDASPTISPAYGSAKQGLMQGG